jgi:hypothetical protein
MKIAARIFTVSMTVTHLFEQTMRYLSEGTSRLFSPTNDDYPLTGVQPFDGEPYSQWVELPKR